MRAYHRGFTSEFCQHMASHTAWPPIKAALKWFAEDLNGIKTERYTQLKNGDALNEKYSASLIRMLQKAAAQPAPNHSGKLFSEYLVSRGMAMPARATVEEIAACVCEPSHEEPCVPHGGIDYLQQGIAAIAEVFNTRRLIDRYQQNCSTDGLIDEAATWLFVTGGRYAKPGATLSPDDAMLEARNYIGISRDEYAERMRAWHAFNPWTVVLARGAKRPNGVSVVLPLSDTAYDDLLAGRRPTYDCDPKLLAVPTRKLLVEIVAERPHDLGAEQTNPTRGLYANLFAQCSVCLRRLDSTKAETFRILTYSNMPLFTKRLSTFGFRPSHRRMHTTGIPFFEKTVNTKTAHGQDAIFVAMLRHLGEILDSPPPD